MPVYLQNRADSGTVVQKIEMLYSKYILATINNTIDRMSGITIENYPYASGKREDKKLNFRITSLANRNEFYEEHIKSIITPRGTGAFSGSKQIIVAKQKKGKDYKVVGFLIYSTTTLWDRSDEQQAVSADYWFVDAGFRGKGVGRALWNEMVKTTDRWGLYNINVMFKESDITLIDVYTKMGFSYIPKYQGKDQVKVSENGHLKWWKIRQPFVKISEDEIITFVLE